MTDFRLSLSGTRPPRANGLPRILASLALWMLLAACLAMPCQARNAGSAQDQNPDFKQLPERFAHVNGVDLGYRILGQGEPLLMIMGYASTMDVWDPALISALAENNAVILFDNRGMGNSTIDDAPLTMRLMAEDAAGLLDALNIPRANVMGWSMGSVIGQELALAHPEKVGKLVLYGSACQPEPVMEAIRAMSSMNATSFMESLFPSAWRVANPDIYSRLPSPAARPNPAVIARQRQALADWPGTLDRLTVLDQQGTDILLVVGTEDAITPPSQSLMIAERVRNAWLVRFKNAGHWLLYQAPLELARVAQAFLSTRENLLE